ncbi:hypothetical protein H1R17_03455 [Flavobacterium sp. xlx-214]|uniref:alpha/beta hydrolase-fold protein n=1 Tax=unclassified Flavobacterium TaxID=196869 RepID=UPI0013D02F55|nr:MULTISPECIES: alpha/beta hydrolase-fold protein [unclassified Flavobacterium]MBA5791946.1 hypothetical protein [Flavobacterium sp. xlx-221]QMI84201.1 hypothetical protein H1R17_03455 [Flavobacterium sp. xlx-214]
MKHLAIFIFCLAFALGNAQENYTTLIDAAYETMQKTKDGKNNTTALAMYENAFATYPDSVNVDGLYIASSLSAKLKKNNEAFNYLNRLVKLKTDEDGYPVWEYIVGKLAETEFQNILADTRWIAIKDNALKEKEQFFKTLEEQENEFYDVSKNDFSQIKNTKKLYKALKQFHPYKAKNNQNYSISFAINDSVKTSYFIHLPVHYSPEKKYPVLFFLHGAVRYSNLFEYQLANWNLGDWNRFYTKYANINDVILVFPSANKEYNWMTSDNGFFMISEMLKQIKQTINVDDDKVFVSGHSNGATGSFSYLMKQPTPFAGFYGFNTQPKVFTGGTFIENSKNRSFINFSTDQDYYYPPNANDDFTKLMHQVNADYKEFRYNGFPHWFPEFDESEPAYVILFNDLMSRKRNSFPKTITWEFDDDNYGNIDWISEAKLDTLSSKTSWHKELNFKIDKWLSYNENDSLITQVVDKKAFDFPRKSGKIKAEYNQNVFRIETSCIKSFAINISPEMINLNKKVMVYVNGILLFDSKVVYNKDFMLHNFEATKDRQQIWVNCIELKL